MKAIAVRLGCALSVLLFAGTAGAVPNAMTISGNSFEDFFAPGCVSRFNGGISNACTSDTNFSYGIPKGPSTAGYTVTFAGSHTNTSVTTSCTVFSHSSTGAFLTFFTSNASGVSGSWSRSITLTAAQAPASGRLTAIAGIPANSQGSLFGLTLAY